MSGVPDGHPYTPHVSHHLACVLYGPYPEPLPSILWPQDSSRALGRGRAIITLD
jgi:hypothetical protein